MNHVPDAVRHASIVAALEAVEATHREILSAVETDRRRQEAAKAELAALLCREHRELELLRHAVQPKEERP